MPRSISFLTIYLALIFNSFSAFANNNSEKNLSELAKDPQWLHLLHYHQAGLFSRFQSQVDDSEFFLSPSGATNPQAELLASVKAFEFDDKTDTSAQCRFPARYHWLSKKLGEERFPSINCEDFGDWFKQIDGNGITLVFPAAYLNSPSSMFGHTLIRIDRKTGNNPLLDYTINYAANADPDDNELVFTYKGLSGGYPGVFTLLPYYQKVKEYSFLESRDVWEYQLELNQEEIDQFIRHIWEIQNTHFDYYFFTENCSYHLLTLLDAASARFNFSDQFYLSVIPADTVRVIANSNIIREATFRPSTLTQMNHMLSQLDESLVALAKSMALSSASLDTNKNTFFTALPEIEKAQVLDLAYQYSRYLSVRKKDASSLVKQASIKLLSARSKLPTQQTFTPVPSPKYRDDQGHHSRRIESRFGYDGDNRYMQTGLRMAYHDLLDTSPGYIRGARLEMFHAQIRHTYFEKKPFTNESKTRLQSLKLIDIASLSPRNEMLTPISWRVETGLKRLITQGDDLLVYLEGGAGLSYSARDQLFYILLESELDAENDIAKGYRVAIGPSIGWLTQEENWSASIEYHHPVDVLGAKFKLREIEVGFSRQLNERWQVRLNTAYQQSKVLSTNKTSYRHTSSLAAMFYF